MKSLIFRKAAAADVEEAYRWYEQRRPGLGEELLRELRATLAVILEHPEASPIVHRETRRALVARFPYGLFYRVMGSRIVVVACMHAKRHPTRWRRR